MSEIIYNSNKAMVAYLIKNNCRVLDVRLGYNDTILFGFDKAQTEKFAEKWFKRSLNTTTENDRSSGK